MSNSAPGGEKQQDRTSQLAIMAKVLFLAAVLAFLFWAGPTLVRGLFA